jgi:photosystem II stability/assembly factor-like uncharacterized protein
MLIATHAMHATLPVAFLPTIWNVVSNSSFGTTNINAIATDGAGQFVAVGSSGKVATSNDVSTSWTQQVSGFTGSNIYSIAYGDDQYIIGGSSGKMATSPDGINWTLRSSSFGASAILGITYAPSAGLWVAVGGSGKLATSIDGIEWTQRLSSFGTSFINGVFANSQLIVAVGYDGKLATSTNGISWTQRGSSFITSTIFSVVSNPSRDKYIAVGDSGKIATSTNGITWVQTFPASTFGSSQIRSVAANVENYYLAGGTAGKLATSTDSVSWIQRSSGLGSSNVNDVYFDSSLAIAVGNSGKITYSGG